MSPGMPFGHLPAGIGRQNPVGGAGSARRLSVSRIMNPKTTRFNGN